MSTVQYNAPAVAVHIADQAVLELLDVEVRSSRIHPVDQARMSLRPDVSLDVAEDDEVHVYMGYDDEQFHVFGGRAKEVGDQAELTVLDALAALKDVTINQSFVDCTPAVVGKHVFDQAGLLALVPSDGSSRHSFLLWDVDGLTALRLVDQAWGLGWDLYAEPEGFAFWGPTDLSPRGTTEEAHVIERGNNLLSLQPQGDFFRVRAVFNPFILHSEPVILFDPDMWGSAVVARVERARHDFGNLITELECRLTE